MPTARDHLAAVAFEGRLWAMGGREAFLGSQYATVEIYDPATNGWYAGTPLPAARGGLAAAVLTDRVFAFGGEAPLRIFSATEMYETAGNRWIGKETMRTPSHGAGAVAVGNRFCVVCGWRERDVARRGSQEEYRDRHHDGIR